MPQRAHLFRPRSAAPGLRHFQLRAQSWRISFHGRLGERGFPRDAFTLIDRDARIYKSAGNLSAASLPPLRAFGMMPFDSQAVSSRAKPCRAAGQRRRAHAGLGGIGAAKRSRRRLLPHSPCVGIGWAVLAASRRDANGQYRRPHEAGAEARSFDRAEPGIRAAARHRYRAGHGEVQWRRGPGALAGAASLAAERAAFGAGVLHRSKCRGFA